MGRLSEISSKQASKVLGAVVGRQRVCVGVMDCSKAIWGACLGCVGVSTGHLIAGIPPRDGLTGEPADLRPWTLTHKVASAAVPHLAHLADVNGVRPESSGEDPAAQAAEPMRKAWKAYTQHMLPHASRQISNFMLACLAEGRNHDHDDEGVFQRGAAMTCELTSKEIADIMNATKQHDKQSAEEEKPSGEGTRTAQSSGASGHAKRIIATTSLALRLAEASKCSEEGVAVHAQHLLERQRIGTPVRKGDTTENVEELRQCVVTMHEHDWSAAYDQWFIDVNNKALQKGIVPNPKQWEILNVVHHRCVAEKTGDEHLSEAPLLRLVHGLPGSGKSKVLEWLRNYFETVWKWTIGHEFVFLA